MTARFKLEVPLEQGPFGTVFRAVDRHAAASERRRVALWMISHEFSSCPPTLAALKREVARLRALPHPNIANVHDLCQLGHSHFVISEFVDGETLRNVLDALRPEKLEPDEADGILRSIGAALAHLHGHGIVHGDVRPENILITLSHEAKLANFMLTSMAQSGPLAPTTTDDVRDLAALAYELYSGVPLQRGAPIGELAHLPRRLRTAISAVRAENGRHSVGVREFLVQAGLASVPRPPRRSLGTGQTHGAPRRAGRHLKRVSAACAMAVGVAIMVMGLGVPDDGSSLGLSQLRAWIVDGAESMTNASKSPLEAPAQEAVQRPVVRHVMSAPPARSAAAEDTKASTLTKPEPAIRTVPADPPATGSTPAEMPEPVALTLAAEIMTVREDEVAVSLDVVRSGGRAGPADVVWWTRDGTAHADEDYASFGRRSETFEAGKSTLTLYIPIVADGLREPTEHFYVEVESRDAHVSGVSAARIRIIDDD